MSRLYVGGPVPNRKQRPNPETITGRPMINTFQGLGYRSVSRELGSVNKRTGKAGKNKLRATKRPMPQSHLCHRIHRPRDEYNKGLFERARVTSLRIDRAEGAVLDQLLTQYTNDVLHLRLHAKHLVDKLIRLETSRGVVRAKFTI